MTVSHCKGVGVVAEDAANVLLKEVVVSEIGGTGIVLDGVSRVVFPSMLAGVQSGVQGSEVHSIGCRAMSVHGGNATLLRSGGMFAVGNTIYDFAQ